MTEAPNFTDGPLDNPDWTEENNRRFDAITNGTGLPTAQARRILGLESANAAAIKPEPPKSKLGKPKSGNSKPKQRRSGFGINADIADSDKRVQDYYAMFE